MTTHDRDKIIAAAKDAGISYSGTMPEIFDSQDMLSKFYAIAFEDGRQSVDTPVALAEAYRCGEEAGRRAEREECANVCEILGADYKGRFGEDDSLFLASSECADAIRARGDTK